MQTKPELHVPIPDVLVEIAPSVEPDVSGGVPHPPGSLTPDSGTALDTDAPQATSYNVEHVVLVDLDAEDTAPGVVGLEGALPSSHYEWLDRIMNVVLASIALLVVSPLMLAIAIAVKLTSKGPVLYAQPRIGLNRRGDFRRFEVRGHPRSQLWARFLALHDDQRANDLGGHVFRIYKFRSMREDAESGTGAVWAVKKDPRSTSIGAFLRKYRLDELPQLFNVLKGDMNIVGPRPERPSIFARLRDTVDGYSLRQLARPGITGWAQINLFYDSCVEDVRKKVQFDLEYLRRRSLAKDLMIMASTLPAVLFGRRGW